MQDKSTSEAHMLTFKNTFTQIHMHKTHTYAEALERIRAQSHEHRSVHKCTKHVCTYTHTEAHKHLHTHAHGAHAQTHTTRVHTCTHIQRCSRYKLAQTLTRASANTHRHTRAQTHTPPPGETSHARTAGPDTRAQPVRAEMHPHHPRTPGTPPHPPTRAPPHRRRCLPGPSTSSPQ